MLAGKTEKIACYDTDRRKESLFWCSGPLLRNEVTLKVSRQRIRVTRPIGSIIRSYAVVTVILLAFLLGLSLLVAIELLLLG